jgi:nucleoside-diphosphate-sugar epimerase
MKETGSALHVVLGAGQIGDRLCCLLLERGHRVRVVRRQPTVRPATTGLEHLCGDITDLAFAEEATRGAAVVYDCMNPPYHRWPELLLPIAGGALHGARKAGAPLVALDCLYMYGRPAGAMREDTPYAPVSRKGELRVRLAEMRLDAHRRGEVRLCLGRASDFFGPDLRYSAWSPRFFERVFAGRAGECTGDPEMPHAYSYADDVARGLRTLGEREAAWGKVWHLPTARAESTRALAARLGAALRLDVRVERVPRWALRMGGLVSPMLRELAEMTYQWEAPFLVDDSRFRTTFGVCPTPVERQVAATAAWARQRFAPSRCAVIRGAAA